MMTDAQEKISDLLQPLLECAEQKRNIDEWNDHATKLLEELDSLLSKQREEFNKALDEIIDVSYESCSESDVTKRHIMICNKIAEKKQVLSILKEKYE